MTNTNFKYSDVNLNETYSPLHRHLIPHCANVADDVCFNICDVLERETRYVANFAEANYAWFSNINNIGDVAQLYWLCSHVLGFDELDHLAQDVSDDPESYKKGGKSKAYEEIKKLVPFFEEAKKSMEEHAKKMRKIYGLDDQD
tara:strand:- start:13 stop:444 length:432 start_codon:yes stop_codon:yes gene_type:complete